MQINFHRTNAGARAAQRRCVRKMFELFDAAQVRRKHAADRPRISGAVSVSSNVAKHGTNIQTRATSNAMQHFSLLRVGKQLAASVVDQHHVKFFRPVHFARPRGPPISVL